MLSLMIAGCLVCQNPLSSTRRLTHQQTYEIYSVACEARNWAEEQARKTFPQTIRRRSAGSDTASKEKRQNRYLRSPQKPPFYNDFT